MAQRRLAVAWLVLGPALHVRPAASSRSQQTFARKSLIRLRNRRPGDVQPTRQLASRTKPRSRPSPAEPCSAGQPKWLTIFRRPVDALTSTARRKTRWRGDNHAAEEIHRAGPDDRVPIAKSGIVELGDFTIGYLVYQPGWRWSEHMRPSVGGDWCQARHVGVLLTGRIGLGFADGSTYEVGPVEIVDIPPGHDGWVIGDEPAVQLEWAGLHTFAGPTLGKGRGLATLLSPIWSTPLPPP